MVSYMDNNIKEYIDQDEALSRIGGNMSLYKRLLGRFTDGNAFADLVSAVESGNFEDAAHQAHTLKGVSANLSLVKLRSLSVDIELLLKENKDCSSCLEELKQAYAVTLEKIAELVS